MRIEIHVVGVVDDAVDNKESNTGFTNKESNTNRSSPTSSGREYVVGLENKESITSVSSPTSSGTRT